MRKFPSQLPGLSELNRGTPQQQASPSAIAQTTKFPLPPASANHDAQTLPIKKALPNGASVQSRAMQAEQQGPDDAEIRTSPDLIYIIPNGSAVDAGLKSQRDNSKRFIQAWHDSGYTYDQLVAEGLDPTFLSGLYRELKLPFPSVDKRPAPSDQGPQSILLPQQQALPPKPPFNTQPILRPLDTQQASPAPAAAPVKITKPVDHARNQSPAGAAENNGPSAPGRQDYIARLMAAKTKKANVASPASRGQTPVGNTRTVPATQAAPIASAGSRATAATAMSTEPAEVPRAAPTATEPRLPPEAARASRSGPLERGLSASEQAMAEAKKKAQTALAKERMAALARNKASKTVPAPSSQAPLSKADDVPATNGVALSKPRASPKIPLQNQPPIARPTQPNPATPVLPVQQRATPVSRIPGLSTLSPSLMEPGSAPSLSQKPSARDPHLMSPPPQTTSTTLFKGERELLTDSRRDQSSQPSAVAPVIIELSDDDDAAPITRAQTSRSPPSSKPAVSMPTAPATNGVHAVSKSSSASKEETQSSRQLQILGMRKKIAELELKRKQKAQENQPDSRPTAAAPISDAQPALSRKNDEIPAARTNASKNDAPPPTKRLKISSDVPIEQPSRDLEPAGARESLKLHAPSQLPSTSQGPLEAASIPRNEQNLAQEKPEDAPSAAKATVEEKQPFVAPPAKALNPKSRRRTELQNKLPAIEASFANNTSRLETLRAQMRELEESLKREREDKDRLIAELESLGVDTEGMDHTELQETKDEIMAQAPYSVDVMDLDQSNKPADATVAPILARSVTHSTAASMSISSPEEVVSDRRPVSQDSLAAPNTVHTRSPVHSQEGIKSTSANGNAETSQAHPVEDTSPDSGQGDSLTPHAAAEGGSDNKESSPEVESAGLSDEAPSSASPSSAKRAQALEPTTVSYPSQGSSPGSGSDGDDEDEDEEGEISDNAMQESDQESETAAETRPQEAHIASKVASKTQSPEFDPPATNSLPLTSDSDMMEEDDEDYEPADALPPMTNGTLSDAHDGPEAMAGIERHGESDATPASVRASSRPLYTNDADATNHMDHDPDLPHEARYKPYKSVLSSFKATAPGGEASATDVRKFDPNIPFCQYEAAGGICNDSDCEDQHFHPRTLKDSVIINRLGLANPGTTQQDRDDYHMGLFDLVTELKVK